ncbi:glycosyltransferase family 4 protein [Hugenholtzia roseola]|uniref:glycosyltransferase family 4 protein n=1 Tax=Hugenholtzia roseola TaxID=1002 RepID=UPI000405B652|nr:glycosyltransferase family 1 protein [Hugenholtzia roseola]
MKIGYEAKRVFHNKTGLGNYSRDLIRILSHYYPQNQYFLYNPKPAKETLFLSNAQNVQEKFPKTRFSKTFYNLWRQKNIVSDLKKDQIQLFHGLSGEIPQGLRRANIPTCVTIHDLIFLRYPQFYKKIDVKISEYKFKKAAKESDLVVAISEQTKSDIVDFFQIEPEKIKVVYQGCRAEFKVQASLDFKQKVIEKYQIPQNFLLYVGTIEARKNAFSILKAIADTDLNLVLLGGETPYTAQMRAYIAEKNLHKQVFFLKNVSSPDLAALYQQAQMFIYPSFFEGFGIPIIEALYAKTPVITSQGGVFPEAGGEDSFYIDPYRVEDLKAKIFYILEHPTEVKARTERSWQYVQRFNDEVIAQEMHNLYTQMI